METVKPFAKIEQNLVTATIDENGDVVFLATGANDVFLELGNVVTKRASHVEPVEPLARLAFHFLRLFGDKNRIADWTRKWRVGWRINTKPVGGPILKWSDIWKKHQTAIPWVNTLSGWNQVAVFTDRQRAIDAEVEFLNRFFLEGR